MNRLIQLAVESNLIKWDVLPSGIRSPDHESVAEVARFAELIVRECMDLTHWKDFDMSVEQRIRLSVYQDIKEHFGVEE